MMTIIPLISSIFISLALVPVVRWIGFRTGKVSIPRADRWHKKPTPTLGGIGIFISFAIAILISSIVNYQSAIITTRWSILLGIAILFIIGLLDDFLHINPPIKLFFQILAATLVIFYGNNTINFFRWPIANISLTLLWIVGITNAINLLDNMDGLAGGVALISSGFLSLFFWRSGHSDLLLLSLTLGGSILGFLVFNFPPAKIFMGDSGSMVLGFTLATLAIARRTQASNIFAIIGVPTLVFLLPILDTALVTVTRILRGQSPIVGGTDHTSHRLVAYGLSERQAVLVLYSIAFISGLASIGLEAWDYDLSLVLIPILLIILSLFVAYLARMKVVSTEDIPHNGFTRLINTLTFKRRIFELIFDFLLIGLSYYLAFWTRYGLNMTSSSMNLFLMSWPIILGSTYGLFYIFGIYRGLWRYIGINDLLRYSGAAIFSSGVSYGIIKVVYPNQVFTADVFLLFILFLLLGLSASRSSFQIMDRIYSKQLIRAEQENVLLYGAEDAGEIALRWILRNPSIGYCVVGFLDDDPLKWGSNIHGVSILGNSASAELYIKEKQVTGVITTTGELLNTTEGEKLISACKKNGIWIRSLRLGFELIE